MGTEDEAGRMLAHLDTGRQAHTAVVPPVSTAGDGGAITAEPVVYVKARETIRRPPLPAPSLYDAYLVKARAPAPIRRQADVEIESAPTTGGPAEQSRQARSDALMVSSADALAALEAWSTPSPRHRPKTRAS